MKYLTTLVMMLCLCLHATAATEPSSIEDIKALITQLESQRTEAVRSRAFIRGSETQLTKVIEQIDATLADLEAILAALAGEPVEPPTPEPEPKPVPTPEPEPTPEPVDPPANVGAIVPSDGWDGPTETPGQIGDRHEQVIAQWNVVPEQQVGDGFSVGIVAHHIDDIDRVKIAANGGEWVEATFGINPRTRCEEYFASLNLANHEGPIELRAIAYPKRGKPRVLTIELNVGEERERVLQAGTYPVGVLLNNAPSKGWLTIRAADGVPRDQVIIKGSARLGGKHVRFKGITRKLGQWDEHYGDQDGNSWWWFDDCCIEGNTRSRWIVHDSGRQFYTDTIITDMQATFQNATLLARNVVIERGWEDICRAFGMMVNVTIEKLDRGGFESYHPDLFQWFGSDVYNFIAQDVTSLDNIAQGLFPGDIHDSAFVRLHVKTPSNYMALQMQGKTRNVLIKDCTFDGGMKLRNDKGFDVPDGERLVFRNSGTPEGAGQDGVEVDQ